MVSGARLTVLVLLGCSLLAGCQATRPLLHRHHSGHHHNHHGRKLMSANWGQFTCSGMDNIGFGTQYNALALPLHGLVMGNVRLLNRGEEPFGFQTGGFRLSGLDGDVMDGELKCPDRHVPAGGVLECGFVAPSAAANFNSLTPFFIPEESNRPCFCRQPYNIDNIDLFNDGVLAPLGQPVPLPTPQEAVRGLANAFEEVFGGSAFHEAVTKAAKWQGDMFGLANSITNSIFGIPDADNTLNTNNGALDSDNNGLFSISIRVGAGPDAPVINTPTPTEGPAAVDTNAPINQSNLPTSDKQADAAAPRHDKEPAKATEPQPQTVATPSKPQDNTAAPKVGTPVPTIPITEPAAKPSSHTQDAAKDSKPAVDDKPAPVAAAPVKQADAPAKEAPPAANKPADSVNTQQPPAAETKPETKVDPAPVAAPVKQTAPTPTKETPPMPAKETLPSPPKQEAPAKEVPAAPKPTSGVDSKVVEVTPPKADSKPEAKETPKSGSAGPVTAPTTTTAPVNTVAPVVGSNPPAAKDAPAVPATKDVTKPGATSPVVAPKHA